jgi:hypothetical protein
VTARGKSPATAAVSSFRSVPHYHLRNFGRRSSESSFRRACVSGSGDSAHPLTKEHRLVFCGVVEAGHVMPERRSQQVQGVPPGQTADFPAARGSPANSRRIWAWGVMRRSGTPIAGAPCGVAPPQEDRLWIPRRTRRIS